MRAVMGEMLQAISRHSVLSRQADAAISKNVAGVSRCFNTRVAVSL
jgi:hypothetical protein